MGQGYEEAVMKGGIWLPGLVDVREGSFPESVKHEKGRKYC